MLYDKIDNIITSSFSLLIVIYWGQFVFLLVSLCFYVFFLQKILCLKIPFAFSISSITYLLPFHEKLFGVL